jgi:hypothetical protein
MAQILSHHPCNWHHFLWCRACTLLVSVHSLQQLHLKMAALTYGRSMEPWKADRIQMHEAHLTRKLPTYGYTLVGNKSDVWGIVPIWSVLLLALGIPILIYLVSFLVIRSFCDFNNAVRISSLHFSIARDAKPSPVKFCGTNLACLSTFIISGFLKYLIGSPRPFFASICQPDLKRLSQG